MSEKILNGADVGAALEEMSRERMAQTMACGGLRDGCFSHGGFELPLHGCLMEVVAGDFSGAGMWAEGGGCEEVLPAPLPSGIGVFAGQRFRQMDLASTHYKILFVLFLGCGQVCFEALLKGHGQRDHPVFASLAIMDSDGSLVKIQILDANPHALDDPQSAAIHELRGEFPRIFEMGENGGDLPPPFGSVLAD